MIVVLPLCLQGHKLLLPPELWALSSFSFIFFHQSSTKSPIAHTNFWRQLYTHHIITNSHGCVKVQVITTVPSLYHPTESFRPRAVFHYIFQLIYFYSSTVTPFLLFPSCLLSHLSITLSPALQSLRPKVIFLFILSLFR